jgi:uncharacterized membrane protein (DUF441 family)
MNYLDQIKGKPTHERRTHAMQMAAAIIIAVFVIWVATLGIRLATEDPATAQSGDDSSQLANVASGADASSNNATLIVAPSSDSSTQ